ncbi:MAG: MBL fold metallo-hydrolase [Bacteroidota bacterium]
MNISGFSTALFSTWYFIEDLGLLFDAGDGLTAHLLQKGAKVRQVFISHADRDHLTGLMQFCQLNAQPGRPKLYYPKDSGSFPALKAFASRFDQQVEGMPWTGISSGEEIAIKGGILVKALRNEHIAVPKGVHKSLSYKVYKVKRKLRPEFISLEGAQIKKLRQERGEEAITYEVRENVLSYSGDTPVATDGRWAGSQILIHEATFLKGQEPSQSRYGYKHSTLEDVMKMVAESSIGQLILGHFSIRYEAREIDARILKCCKEYGLSIPVYRVLPGECVKDILHQPPINA